MNLYRRASVTLMRVAPCQICGSPKSAGRCRHCDQWCPHPDCLTCDAAVDRTYAVDRARMGTRPVPTPEERAR